jgi:hypothetical protein
MSISTPAPAVAKPLIVPLARDPNGRPLRVPSEAAFWRVRRHTRGRPRNVIGVDRKPIELPLDVTEDDLEGMFGAGTYRLDLYDVEGEPLDVTTMVALGEPEPVTTNQLAEDAVAIAPVLPANASDVRLVLETNVRATQLAFAHNERTLTASLRMADTLRDGIRDLANAQATWINTLASARGFFRNAQPALVQAAPVRDREDDDDDDRDNEDEGEEHEGHAGEVNAGPTNIYDVLKPFAEHAAPMLPMLAGGVFGAKAADGVASRPEIATGETCAEMEMAAKPFEARKLVDLNYAAAKARAKKAAKARTAQPQAAQPAMSLQARIAADPQLCARVMALKELLLPAEIAEVFKLVSASTDREQQSLIDILHQYSPEQAVRVIRHVLNERRGGPQMRITPIRVPASEAIPGTPPPSPDEPSAPTTNPKP